MKRIMSRCLLLTVLCLLLGALAVPAFAEEPVPEDGNLTIVDQGTNGLGTQEFYQVQSKNGNTFYIVIDRTSNTENVYFLNQVDEADLMALIGSGDIQPQDTTCTCETRCEVGHINTDCPVCAVNMTECFATPDGTTEPAPEDSSDTQQPAEVTPSPAPESSGTTFTLQKLLPAIPIALVLVGVLIAGIVKLRKKKAQADKPQEPEEDDDDEGFGITEDEEDEEELYGV